MKIEIEEKICIHLGKYASDNGLSSFSAAISRLLGGQKNLPTADIKKRYREFLKSELETPAHWDNYPKALDRLAQHYGVNVWVMTAKDVRKVHKQLAAQNELGRRISDGRRNTLIRAAVGQLSNLLESENSG